MAVKVKGGRVKLENPEEKSEFGDPATSRVGALRIKGIADGPLVDTDN